MSSCRVSVGCSDIDTIKSIISNAEFQKESESFLFSTNELLMYDRLYKVITLCSRLSTMEAFKYMEKNKINYMNLSFLVQVYEKKLFNTFMCYITAMHNLVLCIKKVNINSDQILIESLAVNEIINNMTQLFERIYQEKDQIDFQTIEIMLTENVNLLLVDQFPNCKEQFFQDFKYCKENYFSDIITEYKNVNIYVDSLTNITVSTQDGKEIDIITPEEVPKTVPDYKIPFFNRLSSGLCWFLNSIGSKIPDPVSSAYNSLIYYSSVYNKIGGVALTGTQLLRLAAGYLGATGPTLAMIDNVITLVKNSNLFTKQLTALSDGVKLLSISTDDINPNLKKQVEGQRQQYVKGLTKEFQRLTSQTYSETIAREKRRDLAIVKKEKKMELDMAKKVAAQLAEERENVKMQEMYIKWGEIEQKNLVNTCKNLLQEIEQKTEEYIELKEEYKELPRPLIFTSYKNIPQIQNTNRQQECLQFIQRKIAILMSASLTISQDDPFINEMYKVLKNIKDLSSANQLGISEVYTALGEEFDETARGWSYDFLKAINKKLPQIVNERKIKVMTELVPPVDRIDATALALTAASLLPLVRVQGIRKKLMYNMKQYKTELINRGILKRPRGRKPKFDKEESIPEITIGPVGGIRGVGLSVVTLAFNGYLYGNYIQNKFNKSEAASGQIINQMFEKVGSNVSEEYQQQIDEIEEDNLKYKMMLTSD